MEIVPVEIQHFNNVVIVDKGRDGLFKNYPLFLAGLDAAAIDEGDGTVTVVKHRWAPLTGKIDKKEFLGSILPFHQKK